MAETDGRHEAAIEGEIVTDSPTEVEPSTPSYITPKARTIIYISSLAITVLTTLVLGITVILDVITEVQASAIGTLVYGAVALINSSLGVGFRPTRPALLGAKRG